MKHRIFIVCLAVFFALGTLAAQTKTESKAKAADAKKATCCTKDAKAGKDATAMNANCDPAKCAKMTAKTGGPKMDCDPAKCTKMSAKTGGPKMDCCKNKTDCCKNKAKTSKDTKAGAESKETK